MELLWGVDVVSFGSDWFGDEVGACDDQVNLQNFIKNYIIPKLQAFK